MPRLGDLVNAVRAEYPAMPEMRRGRGVRSLWHRPPLHVDDDVVLGGIALSDFIHPEPPQTVSELRGVFEEFVELYRVDASDQIAPTGWLQKALGIHPRMADWYFPRSWTHIAQYLASLIWYIAHADGVKQFCLTTDSCYVVFDSGVTVGVQAHRLVSKFHDGVLLDVSNDYLDILNGQHAKAPPRVSNDTALASFWHNAHTIQDEQTRERVKLALRILFFRYGHLGRLVDYLYAGYSQRPVSRYGHVKTCKRLINDLTSVANPLPMIYQALVPKFVRDSEFFRLFDESEKYLNFEGTEAVTMSLIVAWNTVLVELSAKKI